MGVDAEDLQGQGSQKSPSSKKDKCHNGENPMTPANMVDCAKAQTHKIPSSKIDKCQDWMNHMASGVSAAA